MNPAPLALAAVVLVSLSAAVPAAPPPGAWAGPGGSRPGQPVYRPGHRPGYPAYRPGFPAYRPFYPVYGPGWNVGYWGPRGGWYYGAPGYWGAWPYAAAWGVGLGAYALSYSYPVYTAPLVVNTVTTPQVFVEQDSAPAPVAAPAGNFWYYCPQPAGYFPYVKECNQPWMKVVPQAPGESVAPPRLAD